MNKYYNFLVAISFIITALALLFFIGSINQLQFIMPYKINEENIRFFSTLLFIVTGFTFYLVIKNNKYASVLSILIFLCGLAFFIQDLIKLENVNKYVDFLDKNSPKIASSISFAILGLSFYLINSNDRKNRIFSQYCLHLVTVFSFVAFFGNLLASGKTYTLSLLYTTMSLYTAVIFLIISSTATLINPKFGITAIFTGERMGNKISKKLILNIVIILSILTFLRIAIDFYGLVDVRLGIILFATSFLVLILFVIKALTINYNLIDSKRNDAESNLLSVNVKLKEALLNSNQDLQAIFDSANVIIVSTYKNGIIRNINKFATNLLQYHPNEIIGKVTPEIFHDVEEMNILANDIKENYGKQVNGFDVLVEKTKQLNSDSKESFYVKKNGEKVPVQLVVSSIKNESNEITGFLGIATDISDAIKVKEELKIITDNLQEKNSKLLNFVHITSHNLRSPVLNLNLLMDFYKESEDEEDKTMLISKFETVITHLNSTLNELIESLKVQEDTGKTKELIKFEEITKKTIEILTGAVIETDAKISFDFSNASSIMFPKSYIESIFLNLISNSIKYRSYDRVPIIEIKSVIENDSTVLLFSDNGIGLDMNKNGDKLFGLNKTFHRDRDSKGFGLYITKTQIEAMGGKISATSQVDVGTTFKINFNN